MASAIALAALGGLVVGSFLNVLIARLPRGEALGGRSRCPACSAQIRARDNVPVVSWLLLRGRCRDCGARISARYPLVEVLTAALYMATVAVHLGDTAALVLGLTLTTFLVPIAFIDLDVQRIPNALTLPAAVLAVVLGTALDPGAEVERLIAGAASALFFGIPAFINPRGMGMGDAKLTGVMGLYLGAAVAPAILIGLVAGVLGSVVIVARLGMSDARRTRIPFGPFLALGGVAGVLVGTPIIDWYTTTF